MTRSEAVQYMADHVGVIAGVDVDFGMSLEAPCEECGGLVRLDSLITVRVVEVNGVESMQQMTEADARCLLNEMGIPSPPVMCDRHEPREISTEAWRA